MYPHCLALSVSKLPHIYPVTNFLRLFKRGLLRFVLVVMFLAHLIVALEDAFHSGSVVQILFGYLSVEMNEDIWDMRNEQ